MPAAIVLAGDRVASKPIKDENKAFLRFRGTPLIVYTLRALLKSRRIDEIIVVGPAEQVRRVIKGYAVRVVNQGANIIENAIIGYLTAIGVRPRAAGEVEDQFDRLAHSAHRETPALFLSCDMPLLSAYEVDEFLERSDMVHYDYSIGLTDESVLEAYRPTAESPGIEMSCFHLAEARCRHNNLHFGKPLKATGLSSVERMYELRYQKKFLNAARSVLHILRAGIRTFAGVKYFLMLQLARRLGEGARGWLYETVRRGNGIDHIVGVIGDILGLRVQTVFTSYGGAVLDVDNAEDLRIAEQMYDAWTAHQEAIYRVSR